MEITIPLEVTALRRKGVHSSAHETCQAVDVITSYPFAMNDSGLRTGSTDEAAYSLLSGDGWALIRIRSAWWLGPRYGLTILAFASASTSAAASVFAAADGGGGKSMARTIGTHCSGQETPPELCACLCSKACPRAWDSLFELGLTAGEVRAALSLVSESISSHLAEGQGQSQGARLDQNNSV